MMFYEIAERWNDNDETLELHGPFSSHEEMEARLNQLEEENQDNPVYFTVEGPFEEEA